MRKPMGKSRIYFPGGSVIKNPPSNAGDMGSVPGLGKSHRGGNGNPVQYSYLESPRDREAWQAIQSLGSHTHTHTHPVGG